MPVAVLADAAAAIRDAARLVSATAEVRHGCDLVITVFRVREV